MNEKPFNILFLEDEAVTSHLTVSALARELPQAKFHPAASVAKAQQLVKQHCFDLLILDVLLPDGNGIDFLCGLQRTGQPVPRVIFLTASPLPEHRRKAQKSGAARFFAKPVRMKEFVAVIRELLSPEGRGGERAAFEGTLSCLTPMDLVQLKCLAGAATGLEFSTPEGKSGTIFFQNGGVVHAVAGELSGEPAVYAIMSWKRGKVREVPLLKEMPLTIFSNWADLMMRAASHVDEAGGNEGRA